MNPSHAIRQAFAPTGKLRASINLGNPILAHKDPKTGQAMGVSVDLARALAQQFDDLLPSARVAAARTAERFA